MKRNVSKFLYFFIGLLGFKANAALATDIFVCDPDNALQGEATDDRHKGCIDVLSWSWGSVLELGGQVGGARDGTSEVADFSFTKYVDKSSPILMESSTSGKTFPKVEIHNYKSCCDPEYVKITLEDVLVSSYQTGGSAGEPLPTENVSLNFTKIEYCYTYIDEFGKPGIPDCYGWDVSTKSSY